MSAPSGEPWQLRIFQKTLKKKEKLAILRRILPPLQGKRVLDLGCAKGTLSHFLRREGGVWISADLDMSNLRAAAALLGENVVQVSAPVLPFRDEAFDGIVSLDFIEHIHEDRALVREMFRLTRPGGWLVLSTPITGRWFLLNRLKRLVGLPPEAYGHVVEGYTLGELEQMLAAAGYVVRSKSTYSRFFTELVELAINLVFVKVLGRRKQGQTPRDGHITPGSAAELDKHRKAFRLYSLIYPLTWSITRLDRLLFWLSGYATLLVAEKPAAAPRE
jgi:2-polyprenyl-3-methyl-5-hydroxy-6-metoxy-1,4-benzoquinol methylase